MLIRPQHTLPPNPLRILIIQLGDIGDVVWSIPAMWAVKDAYPEAQVSVLLREGNGSLLKNDPFLYRLFEVKAHHGGFWKAALHNLHFIRDLRRERFSVVLDLRADERGAFNAYLTGAPFRAAVFYEDVSFFRNRLFTHLAALSAPTGERVLGAAEQSLRVIRAFGIREKINMPRLHVADDTAERVRRLLEKEGVATPGKWVSVNPFSRWGYKEWGQEKWVELIDWLRTEWGLTTVIVGSAGERGRAEAIRTVSGGSVHNLAGRTTLAELAALLQLSRLHIGVDSAAPHIAAAVDTGTVTIYGPSNWRDWAPVGEKHRVAVSSLPCVPCSQKGCDGKGISRCLDELTVAQVQTVIRDALADERL